MCVWLRGSFTRAGSQTILGRMPGVTAKNIDKIMRSVRDLKVRRAVRV